jgi:L-aminopeptidase/D-esterase-like protein
VVGAIAAVNTLGEIYHPDSHQILTGARQEVVQEFRDIMAATKDGYNIVTSPGSNMTIGAVATNVPFSKTEIGKIAQMAHAVTRAAVQAESLTEHQLLAYRDYVEE